MNDNFNSRYFAVKFKQYKTTSDFARQFYIFIETIRKIKRNIDRLFPSKTFGGFTVNFQYFIDGSVDVGCSVDGTRNNDDFNFKIKVFCASLSLLSIGPTINININNNDYQISIKANSVIEKNKKIISKSGIKNYCVLDFLDKDQFYNRYKKH